MHFAGKEALGFFLTSVLVTVEAATSASPESVETKVNARAVAATTQATRTPTLMSPPPYWLHADPVDAWAGENSRLSLVVVENHNSYTESGY